MAEGKKKVIWYTNWGKTFLKLSDEEAGKLIKHFAAYVLDQEPEAPDRITELLFDPIEDTLKRDLKAYNTKLQTNRANGKKGGRPRKEQNPKKPNGFSENPKKGDKDKDSDKDNVTVNESVNSYSHTREELESYLVGSFTWHELVCRTIKSKHQINVTPDKVKGWLNIFCDELEAGEDLYREHRDYKKHFIHWLAKQLLAAQKQTKNGTAKTSRADRTTAGNLETARELGLID